jgi:hypothetical protein
MPLLNNVAKLAVKPIPRVISPQTRAVADYVNAGVFLVSAALFWRRNKRAAVGAVVTGGASLAIALLTDYPGGIRKAIAYRRRREIDFGLAAMSASIPELLAFDKEPESKFFIAEGVFISAFTELSRYPEKKGVFRRSSEAA